MRLSKRQIYVLTLNESYKYNVREESKTKRLCAVLFHLYKVQKYKSFVAFKMGCYAQPGGD